jgi:hypothetical protein
MKTVYVGEYCPRSSNRFEFEQTDYDKTYIIVPLDAKRLGDIGSKTVRKIVRTVYRDKDDHNYNLYYKESE